MMIQFKRYLQILSKKRRLIHDLKLEIQSLRDQVKGSNNSHTCPTHDVIHKFKIDLPRFNGKNNRDRIRWISKIEKSFEMYNIYGDENKLNVATTYMDKTACDWFLWWGSSMKGGILVRDWGHLQVKFL